MKIKERFDMNQIDYSQITTHRLFIRIICICLLVGPIAFIEYASATNPQIIISEITHAVKPEGGAFVWRDGRWVAPENTGVSGLIGFTVSVAGISQAINSDITSQSTKGGTAAYLCDNGESFYQIGSSTGEIPSGVNESIIDPGMLAPWVSGDDLKCVFLTV